jgi:hypothetical protein
LHTRCARGMPQWLAPSKVPVITLSGALVTLSRMRFWCTWVGSGMPRWGAPTAAACTQHAYVRATRPVSARLLSLCSEVCGGSVAGVVRGSTDRLAHSRADIAASAVTTERRVMPKAQTCCTVVHAPSRSAETTPASCMHARKSPAQHRVLRLQSHSWVLSSIATRRRRSGGSLPVSSQKAAASLTIRCIKGVRPNSASTLSLWLLAGRPPTARRNCICSASYGLTRGSKECTWPSASAGPHACAP